MSDSLNQELSAKITELDKKTVQSIEELGERITETKHDLKSHIDYSNQLHMMVQGEIKDMRKQQLFVVKEVSSAVTGLHMIADEVKHFYAEFIRDREEQQKHIQANNKFRDRILGGVGLITLIGTLITLSANIDRITALIEGFK